MKQVIFTHESIAKNRCLADSIKTNLEVEGAVVREKTTHASYNGNLPEGFTPELIKDLSKYNANFATAARVAMAETAAEVFIANPDVNRVEGKIGFFASGDSMSLSIDRSRAYPNPKSENDSDKTVTKHLVITDSIEYKGMSVKSLKDAMGVEFRDSFCK